MNADELIRLLDELAARLQGPAQHTFDLAIRQAVLDGVFALAIFIVVDIALFGGVIAMVRSYRRAKAEGYVEADPYLLGCIPLGIGILTALGSGYVALVNLGNPEWVALRSIIAALKP